MKYIKYRIVFTKLFSEYLKGVLDKDSLITALRDIEKKDFVKGRNTKKGLWFRFFINDTAATNIQDLEHSLECNVNGRYTKGKLELAIENPKGLQIYFS